MGTERFGEWSRIYSGLAKGVVPADFPLNAPQRLSDNLYILFNPSLPPAKGKIIALGTSLVHSLQPVFSL
jgi:hypothetical protein